MKASPAPPSPQARADSPVASPNLNAPSLSERMAALERELEGAPPAFARTTPPPPRTEHELPPGAPAANFLRGRPK
ncbi:hypothetical protein ACRAWD_21625 [Caulobacter segnis]